MLSGPFALIELTKRAYLFSESYRQHGMEGFSTGSMSKEYNELVGLLETFQFQHLELDEERLGELWEPNILRIAKIYGNRDLNIGLIFVPKGR